MRMRILTTAACLSLLWPGLSKPETRLGAHNCYEEEGKYRDRPARALGTGTPLAIEEDLVWYTDPATGRSRSLIAHGRGPWITGMEPGLREYFFQRIRPVVEAEMKNPHPEKWPLITLFLDIKTNEPEHLRSIWSTVAEYQAWLTTAAKTASDASTPLKPGPVQVFALSDVLSSVYGNQPASEDTIIQAAIQKAVFYDRLKPGEKLLIFGAAPSDFTAAGLSTSTASEKLAASPADQLLTHGVTNYHRFWISSWDSVEAGGQLKAGGWNQEREARLRALTARAHSLGLEAIFYCLDGLPSAEANRNGWGAGYNFGSLDRVIPRWKAAQKTDVDYLITDQYEDFARILKERPN